MADAPTHLLWKTAVDLPGKKWIGKSIAALNQCDRMRSSRMSWRMLGIKSKNKKVPRFGISRTTNGGIRGVY